MIPIDAEAARLALLVMDLEQMFLSDMGNLKPKPFHYALNNNHWTLVKYIWGLDALFDEQRNHIGKKVFYGAIVKSKFNKKTIAALRGTETLIEWGEDAEGFLIPHKLSGGRVEEGFYSIYSSLTVEDVPILDWLRSNLSEDDTVVFSGHSLGSSLCSYLAVEVAADATIKAGSYLKTIASPKPGDQVFADWCYRTLKSGSVVYNFSRDVVPDLPPGDDYKHLSCVRVIPWVSNKYVPGGIVASHMPDTYAYLLDSSCANWSTIPGFDKIFHAMRGMEVFKYYFDLVLRYLIKKIL